MIQYGLISQTDARVLEKTIDLICDGCNDETINVCEIGIYGGATGNGLREYVQSKMYYVDMRGGGHKMGGGGNRKIFLTGIDNNKDGEEVRHKYDKLIIGNSNEVYNQLGDNSQHLIFVDGCHCFAHVVSDFFCYAPKVKVEGYIAFHDTGKHIRPFKDFQHGDEKNPDAYISVRKALETIGLFRQYGSGSMNYNETWIEHTGAFGFELMLDEADETNEAGGICVFKKLY